MSVTLPAAAAFLGVASSLTPPVPAPHLLPAPAQAQVRAAVPAPLPAPPPAATAKAAPAPSAAGPYTVHLASYRSQDGAAEGWRKLTHTAAPLAGLHPAYHPVDLPGRGAFVRLTAGRFADKAAAQSFCDSIKATVGYCQPLKG